MAIDVAEYSLGGFKRLKSFEYVIFANVSRMPYFITVFKVVENSFIEVAVGVGNQSNLHVSKIGNLFRSQDLFLFKFSSFLKFYIVKLRFYLIILLLSG